MNVKKLQAYIDLYKRFLEKDRNLTGVYKYESVFHFQNNWDVDAPDFGKMYSASLKNSMTKRLWKREAWHPKEMMLKLIETDQEFVRRMFKDLFDESKAADQRISRFKFGCDEMLTDYKLKNQTSIENNHHHDNNEMILLYLSFRYPTAYCLFEYSAFRQTMELLGVPNLPGPYDVDRFLKLTKILNTFLQRNEPLVALHKARRQKPMYFGGESKLIVHDFYTQVPHLYLKS